VKATSTDAPGLADGNSGEGTPLGRFHITTLVIRRAKQLASGARPRVEANGHKLIRLALSEVMAGAISWSVPPKEEPAAQ
jgi:DNA-directed RNA polymerase subunit K/omega